MMKLSVLAGDPLKSRVDALVLFLADGKIGKGSTLDKVDRALDGEISRLIKKENFKGAAAQCKPLYVKGRLRCDYLVIAGLGESKSVTAETFRRAGATAQAVAKQIHAATALTEIAEENGVSAAAASRAFVEGALLNGYVFDRYKKAEPSSLEEWMISCPSSPRSALEKNLARARDTAEAVCLARDLVNTPANDMTPEELADRAKRVRGVRVKVHDLAAIKKMKMGAFLSVAQGSTRNPPRFIEMHYAPSGKPKKKIAIVGKGVTFDTGGYSIKPAKAMETMKDDMSGAAAVIAVMSLLPKLAPKTAVSGYIAATENMVSGHAQRPGDICAAMDGTTIEVLNTDAEGRLTLADAILYAQKGKPDLIIDMATLTGACLVALGLQYAGVMGNDQPLIDALVAAGKDNGENLWPLPLPDEYKEELKSPVADLKNVGGPYGGTLTAGLFLKHFAGKTKWAHIDIAGPAWTDKALPYTPRGGTGAMVRTIADFIERIS